MGSTYDPLVGHVLDDRYEILAKLARGGMATVYRARDQRLTRTVAVKVMRTDLGEDDEFAAKFDREARAAATLNHPAVVGVFDQGTAHGRPYIVMEFVEGETLRRLISRESPLSPLDALDYLEPIVSALACAHESGLVHRDIKPENVLISARGQVKVADFGLARLMTSPQMTATGVLVGTASYLPPELVTHSRPDARSDVYSAGIVAFEMLTGSKPHTGENNYQIAYRHVNVDVEPPSVRFAAQGHKGWRIPDHVDAFVAACTARDPEARLADGREMLRRLREVRAALTRDPGADDPRLARALRPVVLREGDLTQQIAPRPTPRPRPVAAAVGTRARALPRSHVSAPLSHGSASISTDIAARHVAPTWEPVRPRPTSPAASPVERRSPISPRGEDSGRQPRLSRTPVFPNVHLSKSPVHRRRRGIVALVLVLLLTVGAGFGSWWWMAGRFTVVPALTSVAESEAVAAAEANDLLPETRTEYSEDVAAGQVMATDPTAGSRVLRGETLDITVSLGPERFAMPTVVGVTLAEAKSLLTAQNLVVGTVTENWSETVAPGLVLSTSQEPGALLKRAAVVDLTVSKGPKPIEIADLTGSDAAAAKKQLEEAGFKVSLTEENSATVQAGLVISQTPNSGTGHKGDEVKLVRSLGPVMVEVPDVRYKSTDDAVKILSDLGFKVDKRYVTDFPLALEIASGTDPGGGTKVPEGSTVVLLLS
ncbi:PASTA domain-containing protein [Tessaracoccus sp. OS52]|uniref:Stk1 family PASTA domain-containing Ser/Thr kinase n=1 Tax=Tessaracoccus sp. OS52 TaxID=2886691 RepID=UPI001D10A72F|nr:Stk1 family PASTA domain-containing Ser/Thr kinase [Tessaracoccus sp. OS52]MCC2593410.1 PASTA domain-containing protein [Tessaracoccus sp. OS52]